MNWSELILPIDRLTYSKAPWGAFIVLFSVHAMSGLRRTPVNDIDVATAPCTPPCVVDDVRLQ